MKLINKLVMALLVIGSFVVISEAAPLPVYTAGVPLTSAELTETTVNVSTNSNVSAVLSTASATRLGFDIQITSCTTPNAKIWYSFDAPGVSTVTTSASNVIDLVSTDGDSKWVKQPWGIVHQGAVYMRAAAGDTGCYARVREWLTSSPIFQ